MPFYIGSSIHVGLLVGNLPKVVWTNMTSRKTIPQVPAQLSSMFVSNLGYNWFEVELNN